MNKFMTCDFVISKILLCCFVKSSGQRVHRNRPTHGLAFKISGRNCYIFDNKEKIIVEKGDIIYMPKKSYYILEDVNFCDCYAVNFDIENELSEKPFVFHTKDYIKFFELFKNAEYSWKNQKSSYSLKCKALLYEILYKMQTEYSIDYLNNEKYEKIKKAVNYIHEHYTTEQLSVNTLSEMCNITPEYFRQIFKSQFGVSPIKYINELKIKHAEELLKSDISSVTDAMIMSGYSDISYFSREFKKMYGTSPKKYKSLQNIHANPK